MFPAIAATFHRITGNTQIKLIIPSHGMPFVIPFSKIPDLTSLIDKILTDIEKKDPTPSADRKLKLPDGSVLDPPRPGDWVLADTHNATIIHNAFIGELVRMGYTYMVLPMRVSSLSPASLKAAIKAVENYRPEVETSPPSYS
ncbi:hypothetical protein Q9L58_009290 [Maublancomyces gigas]|uniref:Uncharacterized protein n=1 Tax=Discina gigas TaxID=1032678 RepID=A0ABR3G791_9PEZI